MVHLTGSDSIVRRHRDFWDRSATQPLIGRLPPVVWEGRPYPVRGGDTLVDPRQITPDDIDIDRLLGIGNGPPEWLIGDLIRGLGCVYSAAWLEGLIGCPVYASAFGCTARPVGTDVENASEEFSTEKAMQSPWLPIMDALLYRANAFARGAIPVPQLHLRGVIDMLAAYLGEVQLCMSVYDCPDAVAARADKFADLYILVARRGLELRKPWEGGYVSSRGVYAPGPLVDYQIDASSLFSPEVYARHFLRFDKKVLSAFPYSVVHTHLYGAHILDVLLDLDEVRCVEVSTDREAAKWDESRFLASCQKIQSRSKSLVVRSELTEDELQEVRSALSPSGLALMCW